MTCCSSMSFVAKCRSSLYLQPALITINWAQQVPQQVPGVNSTSPDYHQLGTAVATAGAWSELNQP